MALLVQKLWRKILSKTDYYKTKKKIFLPLSQGEGGLKALVDWPLKASPRIVLSVTL